MFVRSPEKGKVKTRLSAVIDEHAVLELYRQFVLDLLRTLSRGAFDVRICFHPPDAGLPLEPADLQEQKADHE